MTDKGQGYMGDCQNYGPFLGPYYNTRPHTGPNLGDPKGDHTFDNPPYIYAYVYRGYIYMCRGYTGVILGVNETEDGNYYLAFRFHTPPASHDGHKQPEHHVGCAPSLKAQTMDA